MGCVFRSNLLMASFNVVSHHIPPTHTFLYFPSVIFHSNPEKNSINFAFLLDTMMTMIMMRMMRQKLVLLRICFVLIFFDEDKEDEMLHSFTFCRPTPSPPLSVSCRIHTRTPPPHPPESLPLCSDRSLPPFLFLSVYVYNVCASRKDQSVVSPSPINPKSLD